MTRMTIVLPAALMAAHVWAAEDLAVAGAVVPLRFNWSGEVAATVTYDATRKKMQGGGEETQAMKGTYRLSTMAMDQGIAVRFDDVRLDVDLGAAAVGPQKDFQEALLKALSSPPSYLVSTEGELLGLEDLAAFRTSLQGVLDAVSTNLPPAGRARFAAMMDKIITEETLIQSVAESWNRDVGFWVGKELPLGAWNEEVFTNRVAAMGGVEVPTVSRYRVAGRTACVEGGEPDCVRLELTSKVQKEALAEALEQFMKQFAEQPGQVPPIKNLDQDLAVEIVTDPDTLLPWRISSVKTVTVEMEIGGVTQRSGQEDRVTLTYAYDE